MSYQEYKAQQEAAAAAWEAEHGNKVLSADYLPSFDNDLVSTHESYGELDAMRATEEDAETNIMALVTAIDVDRGYYEVTDQEATAVEAGGQYGVHWLKHWKADKHYPEGDKFKIGPMSGGFDGKAFEKHKARCEKKRARYCLEFCYHNNGKVRASLKSDHQTALEMNARVTTLDNLLDDLTLGSK